MEQHYLYDYYVTMSELRPLEIIWRGYYTWLQGQGYQLRDRFAPGWVPTWLAARKSPRKTLDGIPLPMGGRVIDAIRISDGRQVAIKWIYQQSSPYELDLTTFLCSPELRKLPGNHCVEVIDVLRPPPQNPDCPPEILMDIVLVVLPLLRPIHSPRFDTFGEAIDFFRQLFEGVRFFHQHHIAHRDININNVMLDPSGMYPDGFHPVFRHRDRDGKGRARKYSRTSRPPRYIIIDYGISLRFDPDESEPRGVFTHAGDKSVPEHKNVPRGSLLNPFYTDIYLAGNLIRKNFDLPPEDDGGVYGLAFKGFEFIRPLVQKMTQDDPEKRPTIDEVIEEFEVLVASLSSWKLRSRLRPRKPSINPKHWLINPTAHWARRVWYVISRTPAIPTRNKHLGPPTVPAASTLAPLHSPVP